MGQDAGVGVGDTNGSNVGDEGSILDQAIEQIHDEALRARIAREVELLRGPRRFGLVFDRHLPESVRLRDHPVRKGITVGLLLFAWVAFMVVPGVVGRVRCG